MRKLSHKHSEGSRALARGCGAAPQAAMRRAIAATSRLAAALSPSRCVTTRTRRGPNMPSWIASSRRRAASAATSTKRAAFSAAGSMRGAACAPRLQEPAIRAATPSIAAWP
jgi:hypothetical protein